MYCYHPLKGWYLGDGSSGKRKFKVTKYSVDHLEKIDGDWKPVYDSFINQSWKNGRPAITKYIDIPCGQCIGCRLQRSREWANRLMMELESHDKAVFVTLTYDNDHLRFFEGVNSVTGELVNTAGLVLEDLQKFIKDLRNKYRSDRIRYFACGEYGDQSSRPHYHLIIFGYEPPDLNYYKFSQGYTYFTSNEIAQLWPYGFNVVAQVTWESCAYTARYVVKKLNGDLGQVYEDLNIKPPFIIMSTRPGIGYEYYKKHKEMFRDDQKYYYLSTKNGSIQFSKPRYFKKLDDIAGYIPLDAQTLINSFNEHSEEFYDISSEQDNDRRVMALSSSLDFVDQLQAAEDNKLAQIRTLKRKEF